MSAFFIKIPLNTAWFFGLISLAVTAAPGWSQETPANMPIADLHFHPEHFRGPETFSTVFDRSGVRWFGLGEHVGGRRVMQAYKSFFPERYIGFGGQSSLYAFFDRIGAEAINTESIVDDPEFKEILRVFGRLLKTKEIVGFGELFVNNRRSHPQGKNPIKIKVDGPAIRALFELVAIHDGFLAFHMEADADSLAQLEALASSNRTGRIILNHCGVNASSETIARLFATHPNLFCEFSCRYDPTIPKSMAADYIFDRFTIQSGWKKVIIKHADRFMVGTEVKEDAVYEHAIETVRFGLLANLPQDVAQAVAYGNAQRLFNLTK